MVMFIINLTWQSYLSLSSLTIIQQCVKNGDNDEHGYHVTTLINIMKSNVVLYKNLKNMGKRLGFNLCNREG